MTELIVLAAVVNGLAFLFTGRASYGVTLALLPLGLLWFA